MERNLILNEFLNLRKSLNQGNKLPNEITEFRFEIVPTVESDFRLLAVVFGQFDRNAIELARCDNSGIWERSGFTKFKRLENFCAEFLNEFRLDRRLTKNRTFHNTDLLLIAQKLQNIFDRLLVDYAP